MIENRSGSDPVVITGIGLVTPLGADRESSWTAIRAGRCGLRLVDVGSGVSVVGGPAAVPRDARPDWIHHLAVNTCDEAVADSGLRLDEIDHDRAGCVMGIPGFPTEQAIHSIRLREPLTNRYWEACQPDQTATHISARYGLYGPSLSTAAACATGLLAVLRAVDCIQDGSADVMFAGCADASLDLFTVSGFRSMRVLADGDNPAEVVRPFDRNRKGFAIGEGAAMFVLERMSHAVARGAAIHAVIAGGLSGSDAYHVTHLNPDPSNLAWMIRKALHQAGVSEDDVEYINAHGTATHQNDVAEAQAIRRAFGDAADRLLVSTAKSMIGHLLTAAGGVELAITALAVRDGFLPPSINLTEIDPACQIRCTPATGLARPIQTALKLSIAFGGHFAAAVLRHPSCYSAAIRKAA